MLKEKLTEKLIKLLDVKSIVTILFTITYVILVLWPKVIPSEFSEIFKVIIYFYFGTQVGKEMK